MKKLRTALLAATGVATAVLVSATPASAETNVGTLYAGCGGTRIAASNVYSAGGAVMSTVEVWRSGSYRTSILCVRNLHRGGYYGRTLYTTVNIGGKYDRGNYSQYAGAIRVPGDYYSDYSVEYGGSNPEVAGRSYCVKVVGNTADQSARTIWVCSPDTVSR